MLFSDAGGYARKKIKSRPELLIAAELCERWGIVDPEELLDSLTPSQLNFWMAKHRVSPIGMSGVASLIASVIAVFTSSEEQVIRPEDVMRATMPLGVGWSPMDLLHELQKPASGMQVKTMFAAAGVNMRGAKDGFVHW